MFSSILLGAFMACNQPATTSEYVPGVLETDGKLIATVNGVQIKDGIVDSLLKDMPEAQEVKGATERAAFATKKLKPSTSARPGTSPPTATSGVPR